MSHRRTEKAQKKQIPYRQAFVSFVLLSACKSVTVRLLLLVAVAVAAHELVNATCGVDELLLAGEEGVR